MFSAPENVTAFIDAVQNQTDIMTGLSTAGIGVVLLSWARVIGIADDLNLEGFKKPGYLSIPLCLFAISAIVGYLITSSITGYYYSLISDDGPESEAITDPLKYFVNEHAQDIQILSVTQNLTCIAAIVILCLWYFINVKNSKHGGT